MNKSGCREHENIHYQYITVEGQMVAKEPRKNSFLPVNSSLPLWEMKK